MANGDRDGEPAGEQVARLYGLLRPHLDERQRRLLLGAEALGLGRGGIKAVAEATGVHPDTVGRGVREAEGRPEPRVRAPGGGRKKLASTDQQLVPALMALVDPAARGDPVSPLRWTCLSTRNLAGALTKAGHPASDRTVARLLRGRGLQPAGQREGGRGRPARRPGRPVPLHRRPGRRVPGRRGPGRVGGRQEEGEGRQVRQRRRRVAAPGAARAGQRARLPLRRDRQGDPVWHLRPGRERRVGLGRHRPRHLRVRRGDAAPLVAGRRVRPLPGSAAAADLRRLRRLERRPGPRLEGGARQAGRRDRAGDHRAATTRPAPPSGTRSSTGCSPRSPATGAAGR